MSDIIRRKLDEAKERLSELERKANKPEPSPNRTVDLSVGLPELPPQNFEADPIIPGVIKPGPKRSNKFKQV